MRTLCNRIIFVFVSLQISLLSFAQVNLQTGAPQINIPLYNIADAPNGLSTSVSLNYVGANGIKVNGLASSVGTGWDIAFGGSVTRIEHGEPDDQKQRDLAFRRPNNYPWSDQDLLDYMKYVDKYYPNGYLYSEYSPTDVINNTPAYAEQKPCQSLDLPDKKYLADREVDEFSFTFNGRTGIFIIAKTSSLTDVLLYNQKDSKSLISQLTKEISLWPFKIKGLSLLAVSLK